MRMNDKGLEIVKKFEGLRLKPYLCPAGIPTVGYGATTYLDGSKVQIKDKAITEKMATELLKHHLKTAEDAVNSLVKVSLNEDQFSALVSLVYNIGVKAFSTSTILKLINQNSIELAAAQFGRWNKVNGEVSKGLVARRDAERALFDSNEFKLPVPTEQDISDILKTIESKIVDG